MIPAYNIKAIQKQLQENNSECKMIGLLFAQSGSFLAKEEIIPSLEYFHYCSDKNIHFFCGGYSAYANIYLDNKPVVSINGAKWYFSPKEFHTLCREVERLTDWKYSGETDLILLNFDDLPQKKIIDFESAILFPLEKMIKENQISSVRSFFEQIFRFAANYEGKNAIGDFINPPDIGYIPAKPLNIGTLVERMQKCWSGRDYSCVLHAAASILETMAKDIVPNPKIENQSLGGFFEAYRKHSALTPNELDHLLNLYNLRSTTPLAGHGATQLPQITQEEASNIMTLIGDCVRYEYSARALKVGKK